MRTASYERSVQKQLLYMARRNGALKSDLAIVRATIHANLKNVPEGWVRGALAECILRIDRALAGEELP